MNPGSNFSDVRSIIYYSGSIKGVGDVVTTFNATLNANVATIFNSSLTTLLYPFGQKAIKPSGFDNIEFTYRRISNAQILTTGNAAITIDKPTRATILLFEILS